MNALIRFAFDQFYTTFAWTYDAVAAIVSFGEWREWGRAALGFVPRDGRLLEIAHGPGHLHLALRRQGLDAIGIDLSRQMVRIALARLHKGGVVDPALVRSTALRLPFRDACFAGVVSTFPAGFIFADETLAEVRRVMQPRGRFVIVPGATLRGDDPVTGAVKAAYHLTGQGEAPEAPVRALFEGAGFSFASHAVRTPRADVTVWVCE